MCALGIFEDRHHARVPQTRFVEANARLDIRMLARCGALTPGTTTTELEIGPLSPIGDTVGGPRPIRTVKICRQESGVTIDGMLVRLAWDEAFERERPWFVCPDCGRRCRHLYLCDRISCRRCLTLGYASDHLRRQVRAVGRVERLRRRLGDCETKPFAPLPTRIRRGRSHVFHATLVARILAEEAQLVAHLGSIVYDLTRRLRGRRGRRKRHDQTQATP